MSQTTRCPACQTRFKVVADQLRISDGWVRCGNCKQVFDASLSLQPAAPEAMLPDMPLDQLRGPVARVAPPAPTARAWGSAAAARPAPPPPISHEDDGEADDGFAQTRSGTLDSLAEDAVPDAPDHVPSFLKAPIPPEPDFLAPNALGLSGQQFARGQTQPPVSVFPPPFGGRGEDGADEAVSRATGDGPLPRATEDADSQPASGFGFLHPGGYELPAAQVDTGDSDWPALFDDMPKLEPNAETQANTPRGDTPEPDLAHFIATLAQTPEPDGAVNPGTDPAPEVMAAAVQEAALAGPHEAPSDEGEPDWTLVQEGSSASMEEALPLQPVVPLAQKRHIAVQHEAEIAESDALEEATELDQDLSFVRSARRRAFWSGKGVRAGLSLLASVLLLGLAGQVVLHERARVAATWPQSRSFLESACAYLQCSVGLNRDIGAVLVDGSSFNRAQGDRYQFSLTLRNRSALPVEAPAIELTLTDAQDQTVLRRILLPAELAIPNPLGPGQEWSTMAPMTLGQGAARVAGYRVLAFYP